MKNRLNPFVGYLDLKGSNVFKRMIWDEFVRNTSIEPGRQGLFFLLLTSSTVVDTKGGCR